MSQFADPTKADVLPGSPASDDEQLSVHDLQLSAARGSLWTMAHTVLAVPIAFVANAIVARMLGPADYGILAVLTLGMAVASQASNLGVSDGVQQWGAAAHARGDRAGVDFLLRSSLGYHVFVQLPLLVIVAVVLGRGQGWLVIGALIISVSLPALMGSAALCITIENRTAQSARLAMATNFLTQTAVATTAVVTHMPLGVWAARSLASAILLPANFLLLGRSRRRVATQFRIPRGMPTGFWRYALVTAMTGLVGVLVTSRSEVLVLDRFSTPAAVGVFALAFGVAAQMRGPVEALLGPLGPSVSGIVEVHGNLASKALLRSLRLTGLLSSALLVSTLPAATCLVPVIYGDEYASAAILLVPLAVVALSQSLANPLLAFARAQRRSGSLLKIAVSSLVVDLGVAVLAVPFLGVWGAVLASLAAQLVMICLLGRMQLTEGLLSARRAGGALLPFAAAAACSVFALLVVLPASFPSFVEAVLSTSLACLSWVIMIRILPSRAIVEDIRSIIPYLPHRLSAVARLFISILRVPPMAERTVMTDLPAAPRSAIQTLDVSSSTVSSELSLERSAGETLRARAIAFYLPQFHPIKENDEWWGPGFTEWTNTAKARALFRGHAQPHVPADLGFYDLRMAEVRNAQATLAKQYGVEAFCYWHYWFGNGRRILERPFGEVLSGGGPNHKFCLGWANQSWTGIWHGADNRILLEQTYPGKDDEKRHFESLLPAFHDPRYLLVDGKPLFYIFRPEQLPDPNGFIERWRNLAEKAGLKGLYMVAEVSDLLGHGVNVSDPTTRGFDAGVYIRLPARTGGVARARMRAQRKLLRQPERYAYAREPLPVPADLSDHLYPVVYPNWDNTPRSGRRGLVLEGSSPELFAGHVSHAVRSLEGRAEQQRLLFVKSWNEWAEGNYLEPDLENGHGYLKALAAGLGVSDE